MPSAEYQREWKKKNPGKQREYNVKYWESKGGNKAHNKYMKDRYDPMDRHEIYLKRRDVALAEGRAWNKTPKGRASKRASLAKYKARKLEAGGAFTAEDINNLYVTQGAKCYYCSVSIEEKYEIEHMTPISRGGSNWIDNICLACKPCNRTKFTKTAEEFQSADA